MIRRWTWLLFGLALALRLATIQHESLWYDETFTAALARLPLRQLMFATAGDVHPPGWYLIEWGIAHLFGATEFSLRFPAAVFSALSVVELYKLTDHLIGQKIARWSGLVMSILPAQIYYGQEARMYSLLLWLVLLATRSAIQQQKAASPEARPSRLLLGGVWGRDPQSARFWRLFASLALMLWIHNLAGVYAAVIGAMAIWRHRRRALLPVALAGVFFLPFLPFSVNQVINVRAGFWMPPPANLGALAFPLAYGTIYQRTPGVFQIHAMLAVFLLTIAGVWGSRHDWRRLAPLAALIAIPPVSLYAASMTVAPVLLPRALLPSAAAVIPLWVHGIAKLRKNDRWLLLLITLPALAASLWGYYFNTEAQRLDIDQLVAPVRENWQAGDAIYNINIASDITTSYYLADLPAYLVPEPGDLSQSLSDQTRIAMGIKQRETTVKALAAHGVKRLWLFEATGAVISELEIDAARDILTTYPTIRRWVLVDKPDATLVLYLVRIQ